MIKFDDGYVRIEVSGEPLDYRQCRLNIKGEITASLADSVEVYFLELVHKKHSLPLVNDEPSINPKVVGRFLWWAIPKSHPDFLAYKEKFHAPEQGILITNPEGSETEEKSVVDETINDSNLVPIDSFDITLYNSDLERMTRVIEQNLEVFAYKASEINMGDDT